MEGAALSVTNAALAVIISVVGSSLLSLFGCYIFMRYRKARRRQKEEEQNVNAALDRAIVSYIVKEHPSPGGSGAPIDPRRRKSSSQRDSQDEQPSQRESACHDGESQSVAIHLQPEDGYREQVSPNLQGRDGYLDEVQEHEQQGPIGCAVTRDHDHGTRISNMPSSRQPRASEIRHDDARRVVSLRYPESAKSVYGDILAQPLEMVPTRGSSRIVDNPSLAVPASSSRRTVEASAVDRRRDSNWPLPKGGWI